MVVWHYIFMCFCHWECVHCTVSVWCPYRWGSQPAVLVFGTVHVPVKGVELMVAEVIHIQEVKLPPGIVVTLIVPLSGEIQPLRMAKLIPCNTRVLLKNVHNEGKGTQSLWISILYRAVAIWSSFSGFVQFLTRQKRQRSKRPESATVCDLLITPAEVSTFHIRTEPQCSCNNFTNYSVTQDPAWIWIKKGRHKWKHCK